ncbi:MAG TPA: tetratricopeptide repeat protein [Terriglobales bacterium]|nr:tetratricopeptide repeat protein [Terriglobales bacterium]
MRQHVFHHTSWPQEGHMIRFSSWRLAVPALVISATIPVFAFQSSGGGTSSGGSGSHGGSTGSSPSVVVPSPQRQQNTPTFQRPILIMGRVVMEDGSPLPQRVAIRRTCQGTRTQRETFTDAHGTFSFQIGGIQAMQTAPDASDSGGSVNPMSQANGDPLSQPMGMSAPGPTMSGSIEQQIWSCEIVADLPGYRSDVIPLAGRHVMDDPDVGTIVLHRVGAVSGSMVSVTSMQAPKEARKDLEKGRALMAKGKVPEAQALAEKAVSAYPQYAEAWFLLGQTHARQQAFDQARADLAKAVQADPKFMPPYLSLAELAGLARQWDEADRMSAKVMELDGVDFPAAFYINAVANFNLGRLDIAEKSDRRAEQLDSQHRVPRIQLLLGTLLERKHDYAGAAAEYRQYLKEAPQAGDADEIQKQIANLEKATAMPATARQTPAGAAPAASSPALPQNPPQHP